MISDKFIKEVYDGLVKEFNIINNSINVKSNFLDDKDSVMERENQSVKR